MIPFLDVGRLHTSIADELSDAYQRVVKANQLILGPEVSRFEEEFAAYCGGAHCIGVSSGLAAMSLSLRAAGVGPGDEVIVPSHTYIATWLAVSHVGARPVPVEGSDEPSSMLGDAIEAAITPLTKAILPVHLYGHPADLEPILNLAAKHGLFVLEDAAQGHGARYNGKRVGALGHAGAFSFYPSKNLGALGDGGAVVTNDPDLAQRIRHLRNYGSTHRDVHEVRGFNARLDEMQAAFLRVKLRHLERWIADRRVRADLYLRTLAPLRQNLTLPSVASWAEPVWHLFVVRSGRREELAAALAAAGVGCGVHYPTPPHLQPAYADLGLRRGALPIAEQLADSVLSIPMDPMMSLDDVSYVCETIAACLNRSAS